MRPQSVGPGRGRQKGFPRRTFRHCRLRLSPVRGSNASPNIKIFQSLSDRIPGEHHRDLIKLFVSTYHRLDLPGEQRVFRRPRPSSIFEAGDAGARGLKYQEGGWSQGKPKAHDQVLRRSPRRRGGVGGCCCEGGDSGR